MYFTFSFSSGDKSLRRFFPGNYQVICLAGTGIGVFMTLRALACWIDSFALPVLKTIVTKISGISYEIFLLHHFVLIHMLRIFFADRSLSGRGLPFIYRMVSAHRRYCMDPSSVRCASPEKRHPFPKKSSPLKGNECAISLHTHFLPHYFSISLSRIKALFKASSALARSTSVPFLSRRSSALCLALFTRS